MGKEGRGVRASRGVEREKRGGGEGEEERYREQGGRG